MSVSLLSPFGHQASGNFPSSGIYSFNRHIQTSCISSLICGESPLPTKIVSQK